MEGQTPAAGAVQIPGWAAGAAKILATAAARIPGEAAARIPGAAAVPAVVVAAAVAKTWSWLLE